ncbi:MAG: DNA repair exonuclease [Thaumarchaeota archaeon]|nr:DNA repair exonuclease [Candidatus Calditenuaceae archaeon]
MTLIAHMADVHLGHRQYGSAEREQDVYEAFEEAVDAVLRERAKVLLIAGDLFDGTRPPVRALLKARDQFGRLASYGVRVFCVLGDHDLPKRTDEVPPTMLFDELTHIGHRTVQLEVEGMRLVLTGLDKVSPSLLQTATEKLRPVHEEAMRSQGKRVMVAHFPLEWFRRRGSPLLPEGYHYYALGHEHVRSTVWIGGSPAVYPGSIEIISRDEVEYWERFGKGFVFVDLSGDEPQVHDVKLSSVRPQRVSEVPHQDIAKALDELREWASGSPKKPIVHVRVRGRDVDRGKVVGALEGALKGLVLLYRYEVIEEGGDEAFEPKSLDIPSILREYVRSRGLGPEVAELAVRVYEAYRSGGEDAVEELIDRRLSEVVGE